MDVVFCINHLGLEGLGATLTSLIRNCSDPGELKIWFFCEKLKNNDKDNIRQLLKTENFHGDIAYINIDAHRVFGHMKSFHGSWINYGRLLIPQFIEKD